MTLGEAASLPSSEREPYDPEWGSGREGSGAGSSPPSSARARGQRRTRHTFLTSDRGRVPPALVSSGAVSARPSVGPLGTRVGPPLLL